MKQTYIFILFFIIAYPSISNAQYNGNVWVLGDSAGINFNTNPPSTFTSGMLARNGSATICDSSGNLLFYCYGYDYYLEQLAYKRSGIVKNKNHVTMLNGDSLTAEAYHDMIIIPKSVTDSTFYVFCAGVIRDFGLYYSIVDLKQNNGLGAIVQKNVRLQSFAVIDGLSVIKHGNGKDWWLVFQRASVSSIDSSDEYFVYKIDSLGISNFMIQNIGSKRIDNLGDLSFNAQGNKLIYAGLGGGIELFDFDRCTGIISNPVLIETQHSVSPYPYYCSAVFSQNGFFFT